MSRRLAICLINPRSRPSYWTADYAMPFYGLGRKLKYSMASGALVSVAALVPKEHEVVIVDENVETIDFDSLRRFDVIGVTGMVVQAERMCEILRRVRKLPAVIAVGGPLVTVSEETFDGLGRAPLDARVRDGAAGPTVAPSSSGPARSTQERSARAGCVRVWRDDQSLDNLLALRQRHATDKRDAVWKRAGDSQGTRGRTRRVSVISRN